MFAGDPRNCQRDRRGQGKGDAGRDGPSRRGTRGAPSRGGGSAWGRGDRPGSGVRADRSAGKRRRGGLARRRLVAGSRRGLHGGLIVTEISASLVKELRDLTGAGMMDCKRALQDTNGDLDAAKTLLRERGLASAAKRAGRETTEGKVGYRVADDAKRGVIIAVGCETEPVSNNEEFLAFAVKLLEAVEREGPDAVDQLDEDRQELAAKLGENIVVAGAARFEAVDGAVIDGYSHPPANKLGVLVQVRGGSDEIARKLAMHIAASPATRWIGREDVPEDVVTAEREIYTNSDEVQSKPEQAREKIVEGMLNKRFFAEQVLVDQPWIHETSKSVGEVLGEQGAEVLEFERLQLG
ncbi:MAG: translation elongation factor Ts [Actinobacteria bacterium]|nr:MAG: translation elongation factor Ts [Actinomycetota bacterium]